MTIFVSLVMLLVASVLFTLLESARVPGLAAKADMNAMLSAESAFAEYQKEIWDEYDLLFLDLGYGQQLMDLNKLKERILTLNQENLNPTVKGGTSARTNFYRMNITQCVIDEYELATDDGGMAFFSQAVESVKNEVPYQAAETIYEKITGVKNVEESADHPEQTMEEAGRTITEERNRKREENRRRQEQGEIVQPLEEVENPVEIVGTHKTSAILSQVVENPGELSVKALNLSDTVENRVRQTGNSPGYYEAGFYEKILYQNYLQKHFGCYTSRQENRVLDYELEYLLAGKESDQENLESVVYRILAVRLAANLVYLLSDAAKMEEALAVAAALVGFTGNPGIIELAKAGILTAWAYAESILDLRTLLGGGKVALVKSAEDWTIGLSNLSGAFGGTQKVKECENGFSYEDYLQKMLYFENQEKLNYRAMNLIEKNIRIWSGNPNLRMDSMAQKMKITVCYEASPLFLRLVRIGDISDEAYQFTYEKKISYLDTY